MPVAVSVVGVVACLVAAGGSGFPLDDSWIHQDFARTLATTGRFAFQPGGSAAGETSPLWTLLLLPPQVVMHGRPPLWLITWWAAGLGAAVLAGLAIACGLAAAALARQRGASTPIQTLAALLAALAAATDWLLVWAAPSGMETDLFALLVLLTVLAAGRRVRPLWIGLLAGAATVVRPEGLLLIALVAGVSAVWAVDVARGAIGERAGGSAAAGASGAHAAPPRHAPLATAASALRTWAAHWLTAFALGVSAWLLPYLAFNLLAGGQILPSTFYAKTAEFQQDPDAARRVFYYFLDGGAAIVGSAPALLALAVLACAGWTLRRRRVRDRRSLGAHAPAPAGVGTLVWLLWLWPLALFAVYAGRVGGNYHHGRYLLPALPPLLALAAAGAAPVLADARRWRLRFVGGLALAVALPLSLARGAQVYAIDVGGVDCVEVGTGQWLGTHTPVAALVATPDIGAAGYFGNRRLIDITGLIDPELVPLLHDERALDAYLRRRHVAYVAIYESWFPPPALIVHELATDRVYDACSTGYYFVYRTGW